MNTELLTVLSSPLQCIVKSASYLKLTLAFAFLAGIHKWAVDIEYPAGITSCHQKFIYHCCIISGYISNILLVIALVSYIYIFYGIFHDIFLIECMAEKWVVVSIIELAYRYCNDAGIRAILRQKIRRSPIVFLGSLLNCCINNVRITLSSAACYYILITGRMMTTFNNVTGFITKVTNLSFLSNVRSAETLFLVFTAMQKGETTNRRYNDSNAQIFGELVKNYTVLFSSMPKNFNVTARMISTREKVYTRDLDVIKALHVIFDHRLVSNCMFLASLAVNLLATSLFSFNSVRSIPLCLCLFITESYYVQNYLLESMFIPFVPGYLVFNIMCIAFIVMSKRSLLAWSNPISGKPDDDRIDQRLKRKVDRATYHIGRNIKERTTVLNSVDLNSVNTWINIITTTDEKSIGQKNLEKVWEMRKDDVIHGKTGSSKKQKK